MTDKAHSLAFDLDVNIRGYQEHADFFERLEIKLSLLAGLAGLSVVGTTLAEAGPFWVKFFGVATGIASLLAMLIKPSDRARRNREAANAYIAIDRERLRLGEEPAAAKIAELADRALAIEETAPKLTLALQAAAYNEAAMRFQAPEEWRVTIGPAQRFFRHYFDINGHNLRLSGGSGQSRLEAT